MEFIVFGVLGVIAGVSWLKRKETKKEVLKDLPIIISKYKGEICIVSGTLLIIAGFIKIM